ncbi:MAG: tRNA(Ile)-lysidine synthetase [Clostridia bacterium]|jgi:tRNA(Ile)-lysidine synthase|nr:tRNA(Ile)-lysidine synthetase [Clostridia bacterium]
MEHFVDQVKAYISKYNMLSPGDSVVVGVSGGADSLCLLHVLNTIKDEIGIKIFAVHLNHQFRGADADADAQFVEDICKSWNIPYRIESFDVPGYSKESGLSPEEAGREIRYKLFREAKDEISANKVAVAQNLNDNIETILMRLLRGTGLEGLKGIDAVRDDIIRPLLDTDRASIEEYCRQNGLQPRVDKTNLKPIYLRNKIRLELIPYLKESFNPNIGESLIRLSQIIKEENDYLEQQTDMLINELVKFDNQKASVQIKDLKVLHEAMQKRLIRRIIEKSTGTLNGFEYKHFQGVLELLDKSTGAALELPKNLKAYISYENLILSKKIENHHKKCYYKLNYDYDNKIDEADLKLSVTKVDRSQLTSIPKRNDTVYIDASKVKQELIIRNRQSGDMFSPIGMKGSKKLKDYFIDKKIPRENRDNILLIADGNEVVWIVGSIISEKYKISSQTEKVIVISCDNCSYLHNILQSNKEEYLCKMI